MCKKTVDQFIPGVDGVTAPSAEGVNADNLGTVSGTGKDDTFAGVNVDLLGHVVESGHSSRAVVKSRIAKLSADNPGDTISAASAMAYNLEADPEGMRLRLRHTI